MVGDSCNILVQLIMTQHHLPTISTAPRTTNTGSAGAHDAKWSLNAYEEVTKESISVIVDETSGLIYRKQKRYQN